MGSKILYSFVAQLTITTESKREHFQIVGFALDFFSSFIKCDHHFSFTET